MSDIAATLKRFRRSSGMTLLQAAEHAGVTKGYLSKLESGRSTPSIAVLSRLAASYGIRPSDLFMGAGERSRFALVRAGDRYTVNRHGSELGYVFEAASLRKLNPRAEVFFLTLPPLPPESPRPRYRHAGEEIMLVLEGEIQFQYGDTDVRLAAGDCIQFDTAIEHRGEAAGGRPARAFVVIIPDTPPAAGGDADA